MRSDVVNQYAAVELLRFEPEWIQLDSKVNYENGLRAFDR